jgi:hypothetical protein
MKASLFSALTVFIIFSIPQQSKAYDLEACAKDPMTSPPQTINLLNPIDQKMINCIPNLDSVASQWRAKADGILSAVNGVRIGNEGENAIEKLEYNVTGNTISFVAKVRARHTWKETIPAVKTHVPVDKWRWANIPYPDVRWNRKCGWAGCIKVPEYFTNYRKEKVPYVEMELRTITPEKQVAASASATCLYDYTFNLLTFEQRPIFNCGQGSLGNYKFDASAITSILKGEMPSLGQLITSISITPPLFKDANRDEYQNVRNGLIASHQNSIVYFSSESFVNWASLENQGPNVIASILSGGGYGAEFARQVEERLRAELVFMGTFASQTGIQLATEQIMSMMAGNSTQKFGDYNVSVKVVNTPYVIQKCVVNGDCLPEIRSPRLGFAIIATPSR